MGKLKDYIFKSDRASSLSESVSSNIQSMEC